MAGSDLKPVAVGGPIMRRSNQHVLSNNKLAGTQSGDSHFKFPMRNFALTTYPDSDPRWGLSPDDPDYPQ